MEALLIVLSYGKRIFNHPRFRLLVWYPHLLMLAMLVAVWLRGDYLHFTLFINPLPTDERMIAHFYKHRQAFETLVQRYRAIEPQPSEIKLRNDPDNQALIEQAGIRYVSNSGGMWFPNPYSYEGWKEQDRRFREAVKTHAGTYYREQYRITTVILKDETLGRMYRTRILFPPPLVQGIHKYYVYFPEIPRLAKGRMMEPVTASGKSRLNHYVYDSLNAYPWFWPHCRSVFRQIEGHWFLLMGSDC